MKQIATKDAVGHVLCHDITRIVKDEFKGRAFKKGHVVTQEDIPLLLSIGKDNLYVWEKAEGMIHEDDAAQILFDICKNDNLSPSDVKEGKIEVIADIDGLYRVDVDRLNAINELDDIMIATRHNNFPSKKGDKLAGTRVIPLVIEKEKMDMAVKTAMDKPLMELLPYKSRKAGVVTTGSEVFYGRIEDTFTPVIINKLAEYGIEVNGHRVVNDDVQNIKAAILELKEAGAEMIICTGGMSVDPDDLTPSAIKASGAEIVSYGAPVLPGAMFLLGYFSDDVPIMGLPGCVMYAKATIFDLLLPRVAAGIKLYKKDLAHMGNGGLCIGCSPCTYPNCSFGKGV